MVDIRGILNFNEGMLSGRLPTIEVNRNPVSYKSEGKKILFKVGQFKYYNITSYWKCVLVADKNMHMIKYNTIHIIKSLYMDMIHIPNNW